MKKKKEKMEENNQNVLPTETEAVNKSCCGGCDKRSCWKWVFLVAFLFLVVSFAYAGYQFSRVFQEQAMAPLPRPTPVVQSSPTPTLLPAEASAKAGDPTANWKTYTNKKYTFEVKYNPDLIISEINGSGEAEGQFSFLETVKFGTNPLKAPYGFEVEINKKLLNDYRTEIVGHIADKIESEKEITINNKKWTKINYKIFLTTDYVSMTKAVIKNEDYGYAVTASSLDIDQILSTFRFD